MAQLENQGPVGPGTDPEAQQGAPAAAPQGTLSPETQPPGTLPVVELQPEPAAESPAEVVAFEFGEVGTVTRVSGGSCHIAGTGQSQTLGVGDRISLFNHIQTEPGGSVTIAFDSGGQIALTGQRYVLIDSEVAQNVSTQALTSDSSCDPSEIVRDDGLTPPAGLEEIDPEQLTRALTEGADPTALLGATAAGALTPEQLAQAIAGGADPTELLAATAAGAPGAGVTVGQPTNVLGEGSGALPQLSRVSPVVPPPLGVGTVGELEPLTFLTLPVDDDPLFDEGDDDDADDVAQTAIDDLVRTPAGTAVTIDVLQNDEFESTPTLTGVTAGASGTVVIEDGRAVYTPNPGFVGTDSFTYTAASAPGNTATATVTVEVTAALDAQDDEAQTNEDQPSQPIDVLVNDSLVPGTVLSAVGEPANGSVEVVDAEAGRVIYTPNPDFNGTDAFTYTLTSPDGTTRTATVTMTVDEQPDVVDDSASTTIGTPVTIDVLDNDQFTSTPTLTGVTNGANGTVEIVNGMAVYTPNAEFVGTDTFTYTATDEPGNTEVATVSVAVGEGPAVTNPRATVSEAALPGASGNAPTGITTAASGTLLSNEARIDDVNVTSGPGSDNVSKTVTDDTITLGANDESWEITVDRASGAYNYTLIDSVDHTAPGTDSVPLQFGYTASNAFGTTGGSLNVGIMDDVPTAVDILGNVEATPNANVVIVFDRSLSMGNDPGVEGFTRRIDLVRAAVRSMLEELDSNGELNIKIVEFNQRAGSRGWFTGDTAIEQAMRFLDGLTPSGGTHYQNAINEVKSSFGTPPGATEDGFRNLSFFLTDGDPNPPRGLSDQDIADYRDFVELNEITSFAVGVGNDVSADNRSFVAIAIPEITDGPLLNPVVVVDEAELAEALSASLAFLQGNVLEENVLGDVAEFGADGRGGLVSIEVDGELYSFDRNLGPQGQVLLNGVLFAAGSLLTVETALGSQFTFEFSNGDYTYSPSTGLTTGLEEAFEFTLEDADGDSSSAILNIEVTLIGGTPSAAASVQALQTADASNATPDATSLAAVEAASASLLDEPGGDTILTGTMIDEIEPFVDPEGVSSVIKLSASDVAGAALRIDGFDNEGGLPEGDRIDLSDVLDVAGFDADVHDLADFVQVSENPDGGIALSIDMTGSGSQYQEVAVMIGGDPAATASGPDGASLQQMLDDGVLIT
ncbi:MAG: Ig-like domain-containing protein [Gammaproteobacteria bacterium]